MISLPQTLAVASAAAGILASMPASANESSAASAADSTAFDSGIAIGIEAGDPIGVTAKLPFGSLLAASGGVGVGTAWGFGLHAHAEFVLTPFVIGDSMPVYVGAGLRYLAHRGDPVSVDMVDDRHLGARFPVGVALRMHDAKVEAFVEIAPGFDFAKSSSCTLADGVWSLCPHDDDSFYLNFAIGARYFFSGGPK